MTVASDIVVFLGPTLDVQSARLELDAIYLPPAEQGSLIKAVREHRPKVLVLIDGLFARVPAVRHKEILWAMDARVKVVGAASMGALRAAELSDYGMIGCGFIYRWYRRTPLTDDDEVAVGMSPVELGGRPMTEALINMRLSLRRAERMGIIPRRVSDALIELARGMHFLGRTYPELLEHARATLGVQDHAILETLAGWLAVNAVDQKRADAILALRAAKTGLSDRAGSANPVPPFRMTEAWAHDLNAAGIWMDEFASQLLLQTRR